MNTWSKALAVVAFFLFNIFYASAQSSVSGYEFIVENTVDDAEFSDRPLIEEISFVSDLLSEFKNRRVELKASVLLPSSYHKNKNRKYPLRINIGGFGESSSRVYTIMADTLFSKWWHSDSAPQIITLFLDAKGDYGDNYQVDSENNGPYGESLVKELIPLVESKYRTYKSADHRFIDGCSTGGWVSLALQIFYPGEFGACWSYSPDPVTFSHLQLINLYEYDNAFYNSFGYLIPSRRNIYGNPEYSIKQEIQDENKLGSNGTYLTSSGQWCAWNAAFSPKSKNGLPEAIFNPENGEINKTVAEYWKKKDLLLYLKENWSELGPLLQGKINIWMGDMDEYYLNNALREFESFINSSSNPHSDANIVFEAMQGHCYKYNHKDVLNSIWERYR